MALDTLTNCAPTHPFAHTKQTVEGSLGAPMSELFSSFKEDPLASGSIGQVHLAQLRGSGETVVVKVQHPGLFEQAQSPRRPPCSACNAYACPYARACAHAHMHTPARTCTHTPACMR